MQYRFDKVTEAAAYLIEKGKIVYSPLTMTHPIDLVMAKDGQTMRSNYWVKLDEAFMEYSAPIIVLKLEGWDKNSGVKREIQFFGTRVLRLYFWDGMKSKVDAKI